MTKRTFLNKTEGVFVIVNALLPAIIFVSLSVMFYATWKSMEKAVGEYTESVEHVILNAQIAKDEIQRASLEMGKMAINIQKSGKQIVTDVNKMTGAFNNSINNFDSVFENAVRNLSLNVKIPVINKNVPIKFGNVLAKPMGKIGDEIAKPFKPLSKSFNDLGESVSEIKQEVSSLAVQMQQLEKMEIYLDAVIVEYEKILATVTEIAIAVGKLFMWILVGMAILVIWFSLSYLLWVRRRLMIGMALLRA